MPEQQQCGFEWDDGNNVHSCHLLPDQHSDDLHECRCYQVKLFEDIPSEEGK